MKYLSDFFTISSREKRGTLILLSLVVIISAALQFPSVFNDETVSYDYSSFENDILAGAPAFQEVEEKRKNDSHVKPKRAFLPNESKRFFFDPNTASVEELTDLGFFPSLAQRIDNFRTKGGRFRTPEDLLKIYGMNERFYTSVEPWIRIDKSNQASSTREPVISNTAVSVIDINSADSAALLSLPGIGPVLASRVIRYRNSIGGFYDIAQLREVFGIKEEVFAELDGKIISEGEIKRINLNECSAEDLKKHPYFKGKLPYVIVQYREKHGEYQSVQDVKKTDLVNDELYLKIAPYLTVE